MLFERNRLQGGTLNESDQVAGAQNLGFLNQGNYPMPAGMQRFLAKKGIDSPEDLSNRLQFAPRLPFRKST